MTYSELDDFYLSSRSGTMVHLTCAWAMKKPDCVSDEVAFVGMARAHLRDKCTNYTVEFRKWIGADDGLS